MIFYTPTPMSIMVKETKTSKELLKFRFMRGGNTIFPYASLGGGLFSPSKNLYRKLWPRDSVNKKIKHIFLIQSM